MATKHSAAKPATKTARAGTSTDHTVAEGTAIPTTAADVAAATDPVDAVAPVPAAAVNADSEAETAFVPSGDATAAAPQSKSKSKGSYVARTRIELATEEANDRGTHRRTIVNPGERFSVSKELLADLPEDAYTEAED